MTPAMKLLMLGGAPFRLSSLFSAGQAGLWYGTGLTEGYQDSAGTTALTAPGVGTADCPIGYVTDKSGNELHGLQATAAARPVVSARVNLLTATETGTGWANDGMTVTQYPGSVAGTPAASSFGFTKAIAGVNYPRGTADIAAGTPVTCKAYIWLASGAATVTPASYYSAGWQVVAAPLALTATPTLFEWTYTPATATSFSSGFALKIDQTAGDVRVTAAQLEIGSADTTYQSVTTASTYNASGFPLLRRHDGIDDGTATAAFAAGTLTSNMDFFCVIRRESAAKFILGYQTALGAVYFAAVDPAQSVDAFLGVGSSLTFFVSGVAVAGGTSVNTDTLSAAIPVGQWVVLEIRNLDLSAWTALGLAGFGGGWNLNGSLGDDIVLCPAQTDAVRAKIRRKLARAYGVTVV
jgi:hypothetical protein